MPRPVGAGIGRQTTNVASFLVIAPGGRCDKIHNPMSPSQITYSRALHVACLILACAIFPLLLVGAAVTTKEAGMAFPDWPTSNGHLLNPPGWTAEEDKLWEHGHRLIGWVVGMISMATVVVCRTGLPKILARLTLLAIIVQGVMGGLRVTEISTTLAMLHGIWGQVCFTLACILAATTSKGWTLAGPPSPSKSASMTQRFSLIIFGVILLQLVFGGLLRHFDSSVALAAHLVWLVFVCFGVGWITLWNMGRHPASESLVKMTQIMAILLSIQLLIGSMTFIIREMNMQMSPLLDWLIPSLHLGIGAMILASSAIVVAHSFHGLTPLAQDQANSDTVTVNPTVTS